MASRASARQQTRAARIASRKGSSVSVHSTVDDEDKNSDSTSVDELLTTDPDKFDADQFVDKKCAIVGETGLQNLFKELKSHSRLSMEEMRQSVLSNYKAFIRTSEEISDLEIQLAEIGKFLALQSALMKELGQLSNMDPTKDLDMFPDGARPSTVWGDAEEEESRKIDTLAEKLPELIETSVTEHRMDDAIMLLEEGESLVASSAYSTSNSDEVLGKSAAAALKAQLAYWRSKLEEQLAAVARHPLVKGFELRAAVSGLHRLGNRGWAHTLLLGAHHTRLRTMAPQLNSLGGGYTRRLSQLVFSTVLQAAVDSAAIWENSPELASELMLWAQRETEWFVSLLRRHTLGASGAQGGLGSSCESVAVAVSHCQLLQEHGITLGPTLSKHLRPVMEEALEVQVFRIQENVEALVEVDPWILLGGEGDSSPLLSASAQTLYTSIEGLIFDLSPAAVSLQLIGPVLSRVATLFEKYIGLLVRALPSETEETAVFVGETEEDEARLALVGPVLVNKAEDEHQQLALLGNASALADELLPNLAARLASYQVDVVTVWGEDEDGAGFETARLERNEKEQIEWGKRLQKAVDKLRDVLCSCYVAEFMYGDETQPGLTADEYLQLDGQIGPEEWQVGPMPSPPFQAMFVAISTVAVTASEEMVQSSSVVTRLLARLAEWMVMGLMVYSRFWDQMEESEYALGPTGLQQLVLDMFFVQRIAANGKFSSEGMRNVARECIEKAIKMYEQETGEDANRILMEPSWFQGQCDEAILYILENNPTIQLYQGPSSPSSQDLN